MSTFLKRHSTAAAVVAVVSTVLATTSVVIELWPADHGPIAPFQEFYTDDDGDTWFADDQDKITPFDHGGKLAVVVHLFTCDGGKTKFVGYLERLPDHALETYRERTGLSATRTPEADDVGVMVGTLVKRKGDVEWTPSSDLEKFKAITDVHCPGGADSVRPDPFFPHRLSAPGGGGS